MQVSRSAYYSWCHRSGEVIDSWNLAAVSPDEGAVQGLSAESLEILADKSARSAKGFLQHGDGVGETVAQARTYTQTTRQTYSRATPATTGCHRILSAEGWGNMTK